MKNTMLKMCFKQGLAAALAFCAGTATAQNYIYNGGFETDANGTEFTSNTATSQWRFFAVGGAAGSATVSAAAASEGLVGLELTRTATGAGDSALDKDMEGVREPIIAGERMYKLLVDARDPSASAGTPELAVQMQFADIAYTKTAAFDPSTQFETVGMTARSDSGGTLSVRMSLPDGDNSVWLDNVRVADVTEGNRIVNGGFENSASRLLGWRVYSIAEGQFTAALSTEASDGAQAVLLTRTGTSDDGAMDLWPIEDEAPVFPLEPVTVSFTAKKVSGDTTVRLWAKINEHDVNGNYLRTLRTVAINPGSAYRDYDFSVVTSQDAVNVSLAFLIGSDSSDRGVGSFLVDEISLAHSTEANLAVNGGFEYDEAGMDPPTEWRTFAVAGASASGATSAAAASTGLMGVELVRNNTGAAGDAALDKDVEGMRVAMAAANRIYRLTADVKDGGVHGGSDAIRMMSQLNSVTGATDRIVSLDPAADFETFGLNIYGGTAAGQVSMRLDLLDDSADRSALLDNLCIVDATRANRLVNGDFENSTASPLGWRVFSLVAGEFDVQLSSDAYSGAQALRIERTATPGDDGAADLDGNFVAVVPGETISIDYAAKKISGDSTSRVFISIAEYDATNNYLGAQSNFSDANPTTGTYQRFTHTTTLSEQTAFVNIGLRVGSEDGGDRGVGAYLLDDIKLVGDAPPAFTSASVATLGNVYPPVKLYAATSGWTDADGDEPGYTFQWQVNGVDVAGATAPFLEDDAYVLGDEVTCTVTAFDGLLAGNTIVTPAYTISERQITAAGHWELY